MCWPASVMVKWGLGALLQPSGRQESPVIHSAGPATHAKAISLSLSWLYFWLSLYNENFKYSSAFWLPPVPGYTLSRTCNRCTSNVTFTDFTYTLGFFFTFTFKWKYLTFALQSPPGRVAWPRSRSHSYLVTHLNWPNPQKAPSLAPAPDKPPITEHFLNLD